MDKDTADKRHLSVVRAPDIYDDSHAPTGWRERDDGVWEEYLVVGRSPTITPEAPANERWLACDRPDDRLRYGGRDALGFETWTLEALRGSPNTTRVVV